MNQQAFMEKYLKDIYFASYNKFYKVWADGKWPSYSLLDAALNSPKYQKLYYDENYTSDVGLCVDLNYDDKEYPHNRRVAYISLSNSKIVIADVWYEEVKYGDLKNFPPEENMIRHITPPSMYVLLIQIMYERFKSMDKDIDRHVVYGNTRRPGYYDRKKDYKKKVLDALTEISKQVNLRLEKAIRDIPSVDKSVPKAKSFEQKNAGPSNADTKKYQKTDQKYKGRVLYTNGDSKYIKKKSDTGKMVYTKVAA